MAESPPRDLKITASLKLLPSNGLLLMRNVVQLCLATNNILQRFSPSCDRSCVEMVELLASRRYSLKNKLGDRMIKQLLNSVIAKHRDLLVSRTSIIWICSPCTDKSRYFAQPRPIIVNCLVKHIKEKNSPKSSRLVQCLRT